MVRPLRLTGPRSDRAWAETLLDSAFGGRSQARLGSLVDALEGPGLMAVDANGAPLGLVAWLVGGPDSAADEAEIRVLAVDPARRRSGIGDRLLAAAEHALGGERVAVAWLVTTNDNVEALAFYQRRGWQLARLLPGAVDHSRAALKPAISRVAENGIPIRDELILRKRL